MSLPLPSPPTRLTLTCACLKNVKEDSSRPPSSWWVNSFSLLVWRIKFSHCKEKLHVNDIWASQLKFWQFSDGKAPGWQGWGSRFWVKPTTNVKDLGFMVLSVSCSINSSCTKYFCIRRYFTSINTQVHSLTGPHRKKRSNKKLLTRARTLDWTEAVTLSFFFNNAVFPANKCAVYWIIMKQDIPVIRAWITCETLWSHCVSSGFVCATTVT